MYVFKGFKFVINLFLYVVSNLNFKLRHVDFYYLGSIATSYNINAKFESQSEIYK